MSSVTPPPVTASQSAHWLRHMHGVQQQRQELRLVEAAWDNLALLSSLSSLTSQNSSGADLGRSRADFSALSAEMVQGLVREEVGQLRAALIAKAQVCIDILVRNLFERTADIGFLATDEVLTRYAAEPDPAARPEVEARLASYVSFYSVYQEVRLFSADLQAIAAYPGDPDQPAGDPLSTTGLSARDRAWLASVLDSDAAYTEHHGRLDFCDPSHDVLVYAKRLQSAGRTVGVLCLRFRIGDELPALFDTLLGEGRERPFVLAVLSPGGRVIGASDPLQLPAGHALKRQGERLDGVFRHMGREYLACEVPAHPFEGYAGPGWTGLGLVPLDLAFEDHDSGSATSPLMEEVASHTAFLGGELQAIPHRSRAIQTALERSVWNGLLDIDRAQSQASAGTPLGASDVLFAQTLLSEIGATAQKTARAFSSALHNLHRVVAGAMIADARHRASMAMQILDRNLYERANDCRWWALTPGLVRALCSDGTPDSAHAILRHINSLYTVYAAIVLFDAERRVVATSRPEMQDAVGTELDEPWVHQCLQLQDPARYVVSDWASSRFHPEGPTFVYAAALHHPTTARPIGGVGVVWSSTAQLAAMLRDCSPEADRDALAFVRTAGAAAAQHGATLTDDSRQRVLAQATEWPQEEAIADLDGHLYGVGVSSGVGYREYRRSDGYQHGLQSLVLRHLCERPQPSRDWRLLQRLRKPVCPPGVPRARLATFTCGAHWLALPTERVLFAAADTQILPAGPARAPLLGMARLGERVYPVLDLRLATDATLALTDVPRQADVTRQLVVVEVPLADGREVALALRVDALTALLEVPQASLQRFQQGPESSGLVDQVLGVDTWPEPGQSASPQALLMVMSPAWLQRAAQGMASRVNPSEWADLD